MTQEEQLKQARRRYLRSPKRRTDWVRYVHSAEAIRRFYA